jgi:hypothetical protein
MQEAMVTFTFHTGKDQVQLAPPEVAITHFKIFDRPSDSLLLQPEIKLS